MSETSPPAATFMFADIAGFTALTEAHGDLEAADLVADFCAAVRAELPSGSGGYVKTIGDAVMLRIEDPAEAIRIGIRIVLGQMTDRAPSVRVGLHHGPAIERDGDYFGATVNMAARISALAKGGEVLVTGQTAALVPDLEGVYFESRGRHELRNVRGAVEVFAAVPLGGEAGNLVIDPVCNMVVDPDRAVGRLVHEGKAYFFCTLSCAGEFARRPERFVE
jgi:class 3 adenylate cyclase/YHS domain-containing protein